MTPREPDRFDAQARELLDAIKYNFIVIEDVARVAAALRAAESSALERAAQAILAEETRRVDHVLPAMSPHQCADLLRAQIPPAAARAAECTDHWHCDPATSAHACKANRAAPCPTCHAAPAAETVCGKCGTVRPARGVCMVCDPPAAETGKAQGAEARVPEAWVEATRDAICDFLTSHTIEERYWKHASAFEEVAGQLRRMNVTADAQARLAARAAPPEGEEK